MNERIPSIPDKEPPREKAESQDEMSFAVDLNREEFIRFNLLNLRLNGLMRFRKGLLVVLGVLGVMNVLVLILDARSGVVDPVMIALLALLLLIGAGYLFGIPAYVRRSSGKAYDSSRASGYEYHGMVTLYPDRMEKKSAGEVSRIPFGEAVYVETADLILLMSPRSKAIVLPSRCVTDADADRVRQAVFAAVPPSRQKLYKRFASVASRRLEPPGWMRDGDSPASSEWGGEEEYRVYVAYTPEEYRKMTADAAWKNFVRLLPLYSGGGLICAVLMLLAYGVGAGLAAFVFLMALSFAGCVLAPRGNVRRLLQAAGQAPTLDVSFRQEGLVMVSQSPVPQGYPQESGRRESRCAWSLITRAVENPDSVDIYVGSQSFRLPKRCIGDMDLFRGLVDRRLKRE